jgi:hypothetical protein
MVAGSRQGLAHAVSEEHHVVSRLQRRAWAKDRFNLTGPQFGFQRHERQAQALGRVLHNLHGLVAQVTPSFAQ